MRRAVFGLLIIAAPAAAQVPQGAPVPATYQLRVAGPTYFANGDTRGEALVVPFGRFGETITIDVSSGPTLCDMKTPVRLAAGSGDELVRSAAYRDFATKRQSAAGDPLTLPAQAPLTMKRERLRQIAGSSGWRLAITPVREENGALVLEAVWPRPFGFSKGYFLAAPIHTRSTSLTYRVSAQPLTLTLKPGARVLLDRLSVDIPAGGACNAIGLGLEIGIDSSRSTVVESEVWLVHRKPDGSESSEKQTLRTTSGTPSAYVFPKAMFGHDVYGQVSPAGTDGTMDVQLAVGRGGHVPDGAQMHFSGPVSLNATNDPGPFVTMTRVAIRADRPAEVLSFPLAKVRIDDAKAASRGEHEFSLRIRSKQLATSK